MNRTILITLLVLVVPAFLSAQIDWTKHTIKSDWDGAWGVYAIDLDNDNDVDILGAAIFADEIIWWENDGFENFTEHIIKSNWEGAIGVYALDLDDDGDIDVLGSSRFGDDIIWWENDGDENFTEHTIDSNFVFAVSVYAIDMEPDGDIDVLGAAGWADEIAWYENDGSENFIKHVVDSTFDFVYDVFAIDLDDDDDVDVLGAAFSGDEIAWWENDGSENFTKRTIADNLEGASSVFAIDLDDDDDVDVLGFVNNESKIIWWENDGSENFTEHIITETFSGAWDGYVIDLDGDTDLDVMGAGSDNITWWENDGDENFTEHTIDSLFDGARSVHAIDIDSDGDVDILGGASRVDEIAWFESDLIVVVLDVSTISIDIPSSLPWDTTLSPQATVKNEGTDTESFDVTCTINPGAYTSTDSVIDLAPGDSVQVTFSDGFTFETGSYTVTVYTQLAGDDNPANDSLEKVIDTYDPGVAEENANTPETFSFSAPTISRGRANIEFALPVATRVDLLIYDVTGRLSGTLISQRFSAGTHSLNVNLDIPAGVYFYNLRTGLGKDILKKFLIVE